MINKLSLAGFAAVAVWSGWMAVAAPNAAEKPSAKAGHRAVTLPMPEHQLAYLSAGDTVDVMMTFEVTLAKGDKEQATATLMQNIPVVSVDRSNRFVQLMFNPNESQYAVLAMKGDVEVWFARREPGDAEVKPMEMASFRKLFR